jgi:glutamyl-tRNA synthetase
VIRVRFAAAGPLHLASARVALVAWLFARRHKGQFILRIDDAATPVDAAPILAELRWLGLDWDELHHQSERVGEHVAAAEKLKAAGRLYPCFESAHELEAKRDQRVRRGKPAVYDRAMLRMTADQRARAEAGGKHPYWRFRLSDAPIGWDDATLRKQEVKLPALSDPVLQREDGTILPLLSATVDDAGLGITHLIRGAEQEDGTAMQLDIAVVLGLAPPAVIAHLPAMGEAGARRPEGLALRQLRADGMEPGAIAAFLATIGTGRPAAPATLAELAAECDLRRFGRAAFTPAALLAANRATLAETPFAAVAARLPGGATESFWLAVRGHLDLLPEARGWWDVVAGEIVPPVIEGAAAVLTTALATLPEEPWTASVWADWTAGLDDAEPVLRLALTGEEEGPDMAALLPLIGRARAARRLAVAAC